MKKLLCLIVMTMMLWSCTNIEDLDAESGLPESSRSIPTTVSKNDAINFANQALGRVGNTRTAEFEISDIQYVLNEQSLYSRELLPDTLAYIINYANNNGFAIVSADNQTEKVLAYSDTGNYDIANPIAKTNFIDNIAVYMSEQKAKNKAITDPAEPDPGFTFVIPSRIQFHLGQRNPWDKYVIQNHPNCPVGCAAVACAYVMMYSKESLEYNDTTYRFNDIIKGIVKNYPGPFDMNYPNYITKPGDSSTAPVVTTIIPAEEGKDLIAKLLFDIGKDLHMKYAPAGSSAYPVDVYDLCSSLGYNVSSLNDYNILSIVSSLKSNDIIFIYGYDTSGLGGHAWVIDGCIYEVDPENRDKITKASLYCDWGWYGKCNGYFSGDVFSAGSYNFEPIRYFSVETEYDIIDYINQ